MADVAEEMVEAFAIGKGAIVGASRQSALADHRGVVAGTLQMGRNGDLSRVLRKFVRPIRADVHMPRMLAGEQARPRWQAHGATRVVLREPHSVVRHAVEMRRFKVLLAIATNVAVAQIVGQAEVELFLSARKRHRGGAVCGSVLISSSEARL